MESVETTKPFTIPMRELEKITDPNDERLAIMRDLEPEKKVLFVEFEDSSEDILIAPFSSEKSRRVDRKVKGLFCAKPTTYGSFPIWSSKRGTL